MGGPEAGEDAVENDRGDLWRERAALLQVGHGRAIDELEGEKHAVGGVGPRDELANVWVLQRRRRPRLAPQTLHEFGLVEHCAVHELERDASPRRAMDGVEGGRHAAVADDGAAVEVRERSARAHVWSLERSAARRTNTSAAATEWPPLGPRR